MSKTNASSRIVWSDRSWRLRVDQVPLPDGTTIERGFIEHPGAVVLVPIQNTPTGLEVVMIRQHRAALGETILELPAGTRGWQEDWQVCAQRELREETGYRATTLVPLGEIWPAPGVSNELMNLYLARDLQPDPLPADADEEIAVQPMPLAEALALAENGRLRDAKSIIGLYRAAALLAKDS